jgi:hypothetical protein
VAVYTCPVGIRTILKSASIGNFSGGSTVVGISIIPNGTTDHYVLVFDVALPNNSVELYDLWVVLNPGDEINLYAGAAAVNALFSGTELLIIP